MNKTQLNQLKEMLLEELEQHGKESLINVKLVQEDLEGVDNHMADSATELEMMTTELALEDHSKDELERIKEALQAIENGTYGICEVCEKEIPFERLEAIPTALTCVDHVDQAEFE